MINKLKNIKNIMAVLTVFSILMSTVSVTTFAASDITGHWAESEIEKWLEKGLVTGYPDDTFGADHNITRVEFFTIVNRVFGFSEESSIEFTDVPTHKWYYGEIAKSIAAGYVSGYPDKTLKPEAYITRQEAATIIATVFELSNEVSNLATEFSDAKDISDWALASARVMKDKGYINGYPDGSFKPLNHIKRSEAIKILDNASGEVFNKVGTYTTDQVGNLIVNTSDIILKDMKVKGDLYLTEGIGQGDITLDGVSVEGTVFIAGGGEESIKVNNTSLENTVINKRIGRVRVVTTGSTRINHTTLLSAAILENNANGVSFSNVAIRTLLTGQVSILGDFNHVNIHNNNTHLVLERGSITGLNILSESRGSNIELRKGTKVIDLLLNGVANVNGEGIIQKVKVNMNGSNIQQMPKEISVSNKMDITIDGTVWSPKKPSRHSGSRKPSIPEGYIGVATAEDLYNVRNDLAGKYYQIADIDLSAYSEGVGWEPIIGEVRFFDEFAISDIDADAFIGIYDGNTYKITNLTINNPDSVLGGLFGYNQGIVKNVTLEADIQTENNIVGGLVAMNQGEIINCKATINIVGVSVVGGLVGVNMFGSITGSSTAGSVLSMPGEGEAIGGFVGLNAGTITDCYSEVDVEGIDADLSIGAKSVGSLVGLNYMDIMNSYATGSAKGKERVGSLVGENTGDFDAVITDCYATGDAVGIKYVGGLTGYNNGSDIINSYATGNASGTEEIGGLVGFTHGTVINSYATGNASGTQAVGGLAGYGAYHIRDSYATGTVEGNEAVGGLIGRYGSDYNDYAKLINNYAMNSSIIRTSGTQLTFGRIYGAGLIYIGERSNNYANINMLEPFEGAFDQRSVDIKDGQDSDMEAVKAINDAANGVGLSNSGLGLEVFGNAGLVGVTEFNLSNIKALLDAEAQASAHDVKWLPGHMQDMIDEAEK
ncbi:MAG: hypothetical protein CVV02_07770 [Firmicutes bacterium HGW-Firmicutes-7]|nr:MAG: hypothetical protein CVV02_07770 [Firmicutes bacterium HGW-Firmicutes-7]